MRSLLKESGEIMQKIALLCLNRLTTEHEVEPTELGALHPFFLQTYDVSEAVLITIKHSPVGQNNCKI